MNHWLINRNIFIKIGLLDYFKKVFKKYNLIYKKIY